MVLLPESQCRTKKSCLRLLSLTALCIIDRLPNFAIKEYFRLHANLVGQEMLHNMHREFISVADPFTPSAMINRSVYGKFTWHF